MAYSVLNVETLSDARPPLGEKRVSARWGEAGENNGFCNILKMSGRT